jgi:dolichol-phosphate mannosyltransferase
MTPISGNSDADPIETAMSAVGISVTLAPLPTRNVARLTVMNPPILSVVLPAFNEEGVIAKTLQRLRAVVLADENLRGAVEVIVVSDGSGDATFEEAKAALNDDLPGEVVQLVTNVGSHAAIRSGLRRAAGKHVAVLAADGQDPPEMLGKMLEAFRPGIDVVWGEREDRRSDPALSRFMSRMYYGFFRRMTGMDYPPQGYDFVMFSDSVLGALLQYHERNASIFLLIFNLGFGQTAIGYARGARAGGATGWTLRKRAKLAIDMLTAFTAAPIRVVSGIGVLVGAIGLIFGGVTVVRGLLGHIPAEGWASLMVVTSLMGGMILVALGFIGEYLWRTLDEVRGRPLYLEARSAKVPQSGPDDV